MAERLAPDKGLKEKVVDYVSWRTRP
jgi:hypothetical protein